MQIARILQIALFHFARIANIPAHFILARTRDQIRRKREGNRGKRKTIKDRLPPFGLSHAAHLEEEKLGGWDKGHRWEQRMLRKDTEFLQVLQNPIREGSKKKSGKSLVFC